jgi:hypothetical protein
MTEFTVSHQTPDGKRFRYTVNPITDRNWEVTAQHTGITRHYESAAAALGFLNRLADHLDQKYPALAAAA